MYNPKQNWWMNNPAKDMWKTVAPMPTARANLSMARCGNSILAIGGRLASGAGRSDVVEEYRPNKDAWTAVNPIPTARSEHSSEFHGGLVFVAGSGIFGVSLSAHEALSCSSLKGRPALDTFGLEPSDVNKKGLSPDQEALGRSPKRNYPN